MGRVAVPKTGQKTSSPREDATETSVGKVAVSKTGRGPVWAGFRDIVGLFGTWGCYSSTCGLAGRGEDRPKINLKLAADWLWEDPW